MAHTFKRIYLYTAVSFALLFTAGVTINFLIDLFRLAGLVPADGYLLPPTGQMVTQDLVLFLVGAVLVGLAFGGSHYWFIRRDAQDDPGALGGATRHFFVNFLMAVSMLIVLPFGLYALSDLDSTDSFSDSATPLAWAVIFALVFLVVEMERRRAEPVGRAATLMRRIHENVLQGVLLATASGFVIHAISTTIEWVVLTNKLAPGNCGEFFAPSPAGSEQPVPVFTCPIPSLLAPWAQAVFVVGLWGLYVWLGAWDRRSVLRRILRYAAYGLGLIFVLVGVAMLFQTLLGPLVGVSDAWQNALNDSLPFVGLLLTGVLIAIPYLLWIRRAGADTPEHTQASYQGLLAIPAAVSLGFLLGGLIGVLGGLLEKLVAGGEPPTADSWAMSLGALIAGLGYLPLWLRLRRASDPAQEGPVLPRRAYVLAVLAVSSIAAAAFAVFSVYQFITVSLSLGSSDFLLARQTLVGALVAGVAALAHAQLLRADLRALRTRQAAAKPVPMSALVGALPTQADATTAAAPAPAVSMAAESVRSEETLESILRDVAGGTLDPAAAATRIRALPSL